jgi:hypothetical protein
MAYEGNDPSAIPVMGEKFASLSFRKVEYVIFANDPNVVLAVTNGTREEFRRLNMLWGKSRNSEWLIVHEDFSRSFPRQIPERFNPKGSKVFLFEAFFPSERRGCTFYFVVDSTDSELGRIIAHSH